MFSLSAVGFLIFFFFFRVHGLRFCYKDVVRSLLFSFAARFLE